MTIVFQDPELYVGYIISYLGVECFSGYGDMVTKVTAIREAMQ